MKVSYKKDMQLRVVSLALATLFATGTNAQAKSINGVIAFDGSVTVEDAAGVALSSNLSTAAQLDFNTDPLNYQEVTFGLGDFAPYVAMWDTVTFQNFAFSPDLAPSPVDPLWTVDGFDFKLTRIAIDSRTPGMLSLVGAGIMSGNGFDPTPGTFNMTTQSGDGTVMELSFSSSSANVPVPAAIFFVPPVLAGIFGISRRRRGVKTSA